LRKGRLDFVVLVYRRVFCVIIGFSRLHTTVRHYL